ncbi:redoxin domain-containing protein [Thermodesulfobacteriota bacterium]
MVLQTVTGEAVNLASLKGKVVILNFWRIDCPPCAMEKPILERTFRKYGPKGLAVIAVNLFDDQDRIKSYKSEGGYSFTFAHDPDRRFPVRRHSLGFGKSTNFVVNPRSEAIYEIAGVPTTYLINRKGMVVGRATGMINWETGPFRQLLDSLVGTGRPDTHIAGKSPRPNGPTTISNAMGPRRGPTRGPTRLAATPSQPSLSKRDAPASAYGRRPSGKPSVGPGMPRLSAKRNLAGPADRTERPDRRRSTIASNSPAGPSPISGGSVGRSGDKPSQRAGNGFGQPAKQASMNQANNSGSFRRPPAPLTPSSAATPPPRARTGKLPPLPPALPYTKSNSHLGGGRLGAGQPSRSARVPRRQVSPDKNGFAWARIPGQERNAPKAPTKPKRVSRRPAPSPPATRSYAGYSRPSAPVASPNPIAGLINDSFGPSVSQRRPPGNYRRQAGQPQSGSTWYQRLGNVGSGIKSTFSSFFSPN